MYKSDRSHTQYCPKHYPLYSAGDVSQYVFILFAKPILEFAKACDPLPLENLQMMLQKSRLDKGSTLITGSVIVEKL